jgi:hypothetical protein
MEEHGIIARRIAHRLVGAGFLVSIHCDLEQRVPVENITHISLRISNLPIIESTKDLPIEPLT